MTEPELNTRLQTITPPDEAARAAAHAHWPRWPNRWAAGRLETMLEDAAALTGTPELDFARRAVLVLCADNGVVAPGREPNRRQRDPRGAAKPCRAAHQRVPDGSCRHCSVVPVDMGIAGAPVPGVQDCRIAPAPKILPAARP